MRNYSKTGGRPGKPAYHTQALFRYKKYLETVKFRIQKYQASKRINRKDLQNNSIYNKTDLA